MTSTLPTSGGWNPAIVILGVMLIAILVLKATGRGSGNTGDCTMKGEMLGAVIAMVSSLDIDTKIGSILCALGLLALVCVLWDLPSSKDDYERHVTRLQWGLIPIAVIILGIAFLIT